MPLPDDTTTTRQAFVVQSLLLMLLGVSFLSSSRDVISIAIVIVYLTLNAIVIAVALAQMGDRPETFQFILDRHAAGIWYIRNIDHPLEGIGCLTIIAM